MNSVSKHDEKIRIYNPVRSRISLHFLAVTKAQEGHLFLCVCVYLHAYVCACVRTCFCAYVHMCLSAYVCNPFQRIHSQVVNCFDFLFLFFQHQPLCYRAHFLCEPKFVCVGKIQQHFELWIVSFPIILTKPQSIFDATK